MGDLHGGMLCLMKSDGQVRAFGCEIEQGPLVSEFPVPMLKNPSPPALSEPQYQTW